MDRAIYTALSAANAALNRQAVTSNNMANSATAGFRAQLAAFRAVPVEGQTLKTRALVAESTPYNDDTMGPITHTGRSLDVALPQNGWLAVALPDGSEGYTRNGGIEIDRDGALQVGGKPLMGDGAPLVVPVGRLKMVNAPMSTLIHGDDGLFRPAAGNALPQDDAMRLSPESLEGSNVSPVKAMTEMIATARSFEMNMKVIRTADENAQKANQLLSVG